MCIRLLYMYCSRPEIGRGLKAFGTLEQDRKKCNVCGHYCLMFYRCSLLKSMLQHGWNFFWQTIQIVALKRHNTFRIWLFIILVYSVNGIRYNGQVIHVLLQFVYTRNTDFLSHCGLLSANHNRKCFCFENVFISCLIKTVISLKPD